VVASVAVITSKDKAPKGDLQKTIENGGQPAIQPLSDEETAEIPSNGQGG
jgi:hypothetical protein